jgi:FKBP-type peptidyl-prolyl cis-trans isomerase SlyD
MKIAEKTAVAIEFSLEDDKGEKIEASETGKPLWYLHGIGNLVPGLEKALTGQGPGDTLDVKLPPAEAYGEHDAKEVRNVPLRRFKAPRVQVGGRYQIQAKDGVRIVLVKSVSGDYAQVDGNHPLAGKTLHFVVKVVDVRAATAEELEHGHVHGDGRHDGDHDHGDHDHAHDHAHDHGHDHDHDH